MAGRGKASNDWLRALARILQYRTDAAQHIGDDICYLLLDMAHRSMMDQLSSYAAKYIYRHASLCVAYCCVVADTVRVFSTPRCTLAQEIKETMQRAAEGLRAGRISSIGGFVDLASVTELIIDYIDRRGKGRIVLITE